MERDKEPSPRMRGSSDELACPSSEIHDECIYIIYMEERGYLDGASGGCGLKGNANSR